MIRLSPAARFWPLPFFVVLFACLGFAKNGPWFQRALLGMEVGPSGAQSGLSDTNDVRYATRFDGGEIVRRCAGAHAEYVVIWARDGDFAYYDSKLLPKAPGLGARDPLREAVEEARKLRLPLIAYCVVQQNGHFLAAHPEFEMRGTNGQALRRFCFNSGYLDAMKQIVEEQLAYGVDGFHLDMLDLGLGPPPGCWCEACQQLFLAEHGRPMPAGVTWDEDWDRMLEFRYQSSARFERALFRHIKQINPRATVDFNYHGNPPWSWPTGQRPVLHADNADFNTGETGLWGFGALAVGLHAEFYRAATPGVRYQVAMQRGVCFYHDQTTRPAADLRWELLGLLAHGAFVTCVDKTAFDGTLDPVAYERIGGAFADARARQSQFGQSPLADVGIWFSARTRDWVGRDKPEDYFMSFYGAHKAMVYEHIPWGIVLDENVTLEVLKKFPVVLLPNVGIVSEKEVELLTRYVEGGGNLIVTGLSGCFDRLGNSRANSALESLTGARLVETLDSLDNWVRFPIISGSVLHFMFAPDHRADWAFLVKGPAAIFETTTADGCGELLKPARTVRQQQGKEDTKTPMSAESVAGPAVLLNRVGKGAVLTFACSPDAATASRHYIVEARQLMANAVRLLHPNPRVRITAPVNVETVVTDDPRTRTLRIHLIGYQAPPQVTPSKNRPDAMPALLEDLPLFRASIEIASPIKRAKAFNRSTELKRKGRTIEVTVNDVHDVVIVNY